MRFSNGITTSPVNANVFTPATGAIPPQGQPVVVGAVGDGASGQTAEAQVVNLIAGWNPSPSLYLGDVYENGRPMEFNNWYGNPGTLGTYGQFYSITDPVIGNHEYVGSDISGYNWYWSNLRTITATTLEGGTSSRSTTSRSSSGPLHPTPITSRRRTG